MKLRVKCLIFAFVSSLASTLLLHSYVFYTRSITNVGKRAFLQDAAAIPHTAQVVREGTRSKESVEGEGRSLMAEYASGPRDDATVAPKVMYPEDDPAEVMAGDLEPPMESCGPKPGGLKGPLLVNASHQPTIEEAIRISGNDVMNGCFRPRGCRSRQKVAVVIPYKNRYSHLVTLLHHLHAFLQRQEIMYCVFVAEQFDDGVFNKARVMNAAFTEITKRWLRHRDPESRNFDCFIYHDVDMLAEDDRNMYECADFPKHMSPAIDKFNYTTGYGTKYGGVTAIRTEHYIRVNGHSNRFWGWGGEDNDMETRIFSNNLNITTVNETIGRYKMIEHIHPWWFDPASGVGSYLTKKKIARKTRSWHEAPSKEKDTEGTDKSGLSDIHYTLIETQRHKLWTKLTVDIRYHVVEKVVVHLVDTNQEMTITSLDSMKHEDAEKDGSKESDEALLPDTDNCQPTYYRFMYMTVNRTEPVNEEGDDYSVVYTSLQDAQTRCTEMRTGCQSIVEQMAERYTLRSTSYLHENTLIYKYGLAEQYDVTEKHHSTSTFVKVCKDNQRYTQFFTEPIILKGDAHAGVSPRFYMEFFIRLFHPSNSIFTYHSQTMSTHRAAMEEKLVNHMIGKTWWDSLGRMQFGRTKLMNMSDGERLDMMTHERDAHSRLIHVRTPMSGIARKTGCFVIKSQVLDDDTKECPLQWKWWFQVRAKNQEMEKEFLDEDLKRSIKTGEEFKKMMQNQKSAMNVFAEQQLAKEEQKRKDAYLKAMKEKS